MEKNFEKLKSQKNLLFKFPSGDNRMWRWTCVYNSNQSNVTSSSLKVSNIYHQWFLRNAADNIDFINRLMMINSDRKWILNNNYCSTNFRWRGIIPKNLTEIGHAVSKKSLHKLGGGRIKRKVKKKKKIIENLPLKTEDPY